MLHKLFVSFLFLSLLIVGCSENLDTEPPQLFIDDTRMTQDIKNVCFEDVEVATLSGGDTIVYTVSGSDNQALSQLKYDIHHNFDCHGHGGSSAPNIGGEIIGNTEDISTVEIIELNGAADFQRDLIIPVPEDVTSGPYHFLVSLVDEEANEDRSHGALTLYARNAADSILPTLNINSPTSPTINIKKGDAITFSAEVSDNRKLSEGGNAHLRFFLRSQSSNNIFSVHETILFNETQEKNVDISEDIFIPQSLSSGNYDMIIAVYDGVRNEHVYSPFTCIID